MSNEMFWTALGTVSFYPTFFYILLMDFFPRKTKHIRAPMKPFVKYGTMPFTLVWMSPDWVWEREAEARRVRAIGVVVVMVWSFIWLRIWFDDVDDDWWKKKRKKAASKIKQMFGRLVVVPG